MVKDSEHLDDIQSKVAAGITDFSHVDVVFLLRMVRNLKAAVGVTLQP